MFKTVYIAVASTGGMFGYMSEPIAASTKKRGLLELAREIANEHHKKIGIRDGEAVYINYKNSDFKIIEVPLIK